MRSGEVRKIHIECRATIGAVAKYGGVPPYRETLADVDKVTALHARYRAAMGLKPLQAGLRAAE